MEGDPRLQLIIIQNFTSVKKMLLSEADRMIIWSRAWTTPGLYTPDIYMDMSSY